MHCRARRMEKLNSVDYRNSCKYTTLGVGSKDDHIYFGFFHKSKYVHGALVRGRVKCVTRDSWTSNFFPYRDNKICDFQKTVGITSSLPVKLHRFSLVSLYPGLEQILVEAVHSNRQPLNYVKNDVTRNCQEVYGLAKVKQAS